MQSFLSANRLLSIWEGTKQDTWKRESFFWRKLGDGVPLFSIVRWRLVEIGEIVFQNRSMRADDKTE